MNDNIFNNKPLQYQRIANATKEISFDMASDMQTGSLLKTLVASKCNANILELGTGTGLATSWIIDGMAANSRLVTIDNNELLLNIAKEQLQDARIKFIFADAYEWISKYDGQKFDFIFADAIPGKYDLLEETLTLLNPGGLYVIDDMLPQPNWPEGHNVKAEALIQTLEKRSDLAITKLNWSTGIIICCKSQIINS